MTARKANPQKRGSKGYYTGSRLEFLTSHCDEYASLRGKDRHQFWFNLFGEWWKRYPWHLQDHEEPPTNDPERMAELARAESDEDKQEKMKVEQRVRDRITGWFSYRASSRTSHEETTWSPLLKRLHKQSNTKPRCRSIGQQFMHEDPSIVNAAFVSKYGEGRGMEPIERLNKRNKLATHLINTTYKHLAAGLEARAKKTHEGELKEWALKLERVEQAEDVHLARDSLFSAVHPLLKLIGTYSGCYVTLLVASRDHAGNDPYFSAIHHFPQDNTSRVNWTKFDKSGFKNGVMGPFFKYIQWMEASEGELSERTTPAPESTPAPSVPPPQTVHLKAALPKTASTSQQPGRYKKRPFAYMEDNVVVDDDVDMDNIEDNDSSGSSVDSDHVPAKRLRTSIATRSLRKTPTPESPATKAHIHQNFPPAVDGSSSGPSVDSGRLPVKHLRTFIAMRNSRKTPTPESPATKANARRNSPSAVDNDSPVPDDLNVEPEPRIPHPSPEDMGIDGPGVNPEPRNAASIDVHHIHESVNPLPATPLQPRSPSPGAMSDSELGVPDFLVGKHDIYSYLSTVEEPGFQALLKSYIKFELADRSSIRGVFTTAYRPTAVGWWSNRARPNKLPPYDSLSSFASSIVEWWTFIQPGWRRIEPSKIARTEGDWERLYQPGVNGLLNIIVLAHWWARILGERECPINDTYSWFVSDVTWVLSRLTAAAHEGIY